MLRCQLRVGHQRLQDSGQKDDEVIIDHIPIKTFANVQSTTEALEPRWIDDGRVNALQCNVMLT